MKVLYVTNYQGDAVVKRKHRRNRTLGPDRKVEVIAKALATQGHAVAMVTPATVSEATCRMYSGFLSQLTRDGGGEIPVTYLRALDIPRVNLIFAAKELRSYLKQAPKCDVVLIYNLEWYFLRPVLDFVSRVGAALVVEYEDDALAAIGVRAKRWHRARGEAAIRAARANANGVVGVSHELVEQLGVPNCALLPGVVGNDLLDIPRTQRDSSHRDPGVRPLRCVYAGGLSREKGPDLLVQAAIQLGPCVEVDIVGSGRELSHLRGLAMLSGGRVRVHGEVSRARLVELMGSADVAVNPHRTDTHQVGQIFPFKILEYMAAGLPVVSSRLPNSIGPHIDQIVMYSDESPGGLSAALIAARDRLGVSRNYAIAAREWVRREFAEEAVGRKIDEVCQQAVRDVRSSRARPVLPLA